MTTEKILISQTHHKKVEVGYRESRKSQQVKAS